MQGIVRVKKCCYICRCRPHRRARSRAMWVGLYHRLAAWHAKTYEKRYLTLFLDKRKSGKFQSSSRMMQTVDVLVDMYILSAPGARALGMAVYHILREALQVCSFSYDGQYQSLDEWDEQTVRLSRFFFINQSNANEVGPEAPKTNYEQSLFQALGWQRL